MVRQKAASIVKPPLNKPQNQIYLLKGVGYVFYYKR